MAIDGIIVANGIMNVHPRRKLITNSIRHDHQYSARRARPSKVAYFVQNSLQASIISILRIRIPLGAVL